MVVTGFHPEPNYILASTASIAFLMTAATAHWLVAWHHQIPLSLALVFSSIWFHTQKSYMSYIADQMMIFLWVTGATYEAYMKGPIPVSLLVLGVLYNVLIFYGGFLGNCFAFDNNKTVSTFFHSTVHFVSFFGFTGALFLMPLPKLTTIKFGLSKRVYILT
jgi:hypothetical protein